MNEQVKRHYRMGGKLTHCGVEILPNGKDIMCIFIKDVTFYERHSVAGKPVENVWVARFEDNVYTDLPMLLNSTNRKRLAKQAGTNYLEDVKHFPVRITQESTRDVQDGGTTMGLRISKSKAVVPAEPAKEVMTVDHANFDKCKAHLSNGGSVDDLRIKYEISKEVEDALKN